MVWFSKVRDTAGKVRRLMILVATPSLRGVRLVNQIFLLGLSTPPHEICTDADEHNRGKPWSRLAGCGDGSR